MRKIILFCLMFVLSCCSFLFSSGWQKGFFTLGEVEGREIFLDPDGKPFYALSMVYDFGPFPRPGGKEITKENVIAQLVKMKADGFNTLNLYGDMFLDDVLSWCDANGMAVYFRTQHTTDEFPDFMSAETRKKAKAFYDAFMPKIKKYHCVLAVDMDQRWLFSVDWAGRKRPGHVMLGKEGIKQMPEWLNKKYSRVSVLNARWKKSYKSFDDVVKDAEIISSNAVKKLDREPWRNDFYEYTLWTINDFLKDLSAHMKKINANHLVTYTSELPEVFPFPVSTKENSGMDFISPVHYNAEEDYNRDWIGSAELLYMTKLHYDLNGDMPVYISESGWRTKTLNQDPPHKGYAMGKENDEEFAAEMYLREASLLSVYPWISGWAYFMWYDKEVEGDFGYVRNDGSRKPMSIMGSLVNSTLSPNLKKEAEPEAWIYYPEYALHTPLASYRQLKTLVLLLGQDFFREYEKIITAFLKKKDLAALSGLKDVFNAKWYPYKFTSIIPFDDKPVILAGNALNQLSSEDRKKLLAKKTVTIGPVGIEDENYNPAKGFFLESAGAEAPAAENITVDLSGYLNHGIKLSAENKKIKAAVSGMEYEFSFSGKSDNVTCLGQKIEFKNDFFSSVNFLAGAEKNDVCEKVIFYYESGRTVEKYLDSSVNCWDYRPHFSGLGFEAPGNQGGKYYLADINIPVPATEKLVAVKLPDNPKVHIFAVTLQKNGIPDASNIKIDFNGKTIEGMSYWYYPLLNSSSVSLLSLLSGLPLVIQSKDKRHVSFLYDPLTWEGKKDELSLFVEDNSRILKMALDAVNGGGK